MSWMSALSELGIKILSSSGHPWALDPHSRIHQGKMFNASFMARAVANDASIYMALTTPASDYPHLSVFPSCSGAAEFALYEDSALLGGTSINIQNHKRYSNNAFEGSVVHTPTILSLGTPITEFLMPGGSFIFAVGSAPNFDLEWVLKNSTNYLMQVTNRSAGAATLSINAAFYSAPGLADVR